MSTEIETSHSRFNLSHVSFYCVALFAGIWLCMGNYWSIVATYSTIEFNTFVVFSYALIYMLAVIPVTVIFFLELNSLKSRLKWIIFGTVIIFFTFVIAPPRNADAMRVWLAKVYDVWMNGKKITRPYWHYNTPDAFTLFHLPLINIGDGQVFQLSIWTALCAVIIIFIKLGRIYANDRIVGIGICLFIFNPLIIMASTVVITDVPICLAVIGLIYSIVLYEQRNFNRSLVFIVLFLSFGMNIKYNMLMFLPVIIFWLMWKTLKNGIHLKTVPVELFLFFLAVLPYLMNYIYIGNPVWPALVKLFPSKNPYWDEIALRHSENFLGGQFTIISFLHSFMKLFLMPQYINPIATCIAFFIFTRYKYLNFLPALLATTYLLILWLMMPNFADDEKQRYVLYLFPIIIPLGTARIYNILSSLKNIGLLKNVLNTAIVMTVFIYGVFTIYYAKDVFAYIITGDKYKWHRATWYYEDYDWINKNIKLDRSGQILVLVSAQQTYYLRHRYINADRISAMINWNSIRNVDSLIHVLNKHNIRYVFIDNSILKEDTHMSTAFEWLIKEKLIERIRENNSKLYYSRLKDSYIDTKTVLYKIR